MPDFNPATLDADKCPAPDFSAIAEATKNALCNIDQRSLERDQALVVEHKKLLAKVQLLDEGNVTDVLATINNFITSIDKDGDGNIDGLAELISVSQTLGQRVIDLENWRGLTAQQLVDIQRQQTLSQEAMQRHAQEISDLKSREDKVGVSEERVVEIAGDVVCAAVLKPLQSAASNFADALNAIDCGTAGHTAFMTDLVGAATTATTTTTTTTETTTTAPESSGPEADVLG